MSSSTSMQARRQDLRGSIARVTERCSACENSRHSYKFVCFQSRIDKLQVATRNGCRFCSFVLDCIKVFSADLLRGRFAVKCEDWGIINITLTDVNGERNDLELNIFLVDGASSPIENIGIECLLLGDTSSNDSLMRAKHWLGQCTRDHQKCGPAVEAPLLRRILDLSEDNIFLSEHNVDPSLYVCLSYCWGVAKPAIMTTRSTVTLYKEHIPWEPLPQTFKDAIDICRRLGVRFLWVDALCIIQDDEDDWREEASKMGDVYERAYFTRAASKGHDSASGCYSVAESQYMAQQVLPHNVYVRQRLPQPPYLGWEHRHIPATAENFPIFWRAWIYQERCLSHQILYSLATSLSGNAKRD